MHPFINVTESFHIPVFGLMMLCGMIAAFIIIAANRKYQPYDEDTLYSMAIVTILSGLVGAKLMYWAVEWDEIVRNPHFLLESLNAGFVFYGSLIGGALGLLIFTIVKKQTFFSYTDLVLPGFMAGQGVGRIGCFFAGCCYGRLTDSWIGVTFPAGTAAAGTRIPTQLMECAFCLICGVALMMVMRKQKRYGLTSALYCILYGIWRFIIECFRDDDRGAVGGLSTSQFIGIFIILAGFVLLFVYFKKMTKECVYQGENEQDMNTVDNQMELSTENVDNNPKNVDNMDNPEEKGKKEE